MITIYTSPSCSSCRKVKKFLDDEHVQYREKNIFATILKEEELKDILEKTENGTEDIISTRSKIIKEGNVDIDSMSMKELLQFIKDNPSILKRPILVDDMSIQVGYSKDEVASFIARAKKLAGESCPHKGLCEYCKECDCEPNKN